MAASNVVFPYPFAPTTAIHAPRPFESDTRSSAGAAASSKTTVASRREISGEDMVEAAMNELWGAGQASTWFQENISK